MPPIPKPEPRTVAAIYQAYVDANEHFDSLGISVGEIGAECDRALWYGLHWASEPEPLTGQKISIFRTGDMWEDRLVADLESIGVTVTGQQDRIRLVAGHVRGKCDGRGTGVPEAPVTEHLFEFKSSNAANYRLIVRDGCLKAKPLHYAQCQLGMHGFGLTRALYLVVNKDTDERYSERINYDAGYCLRLLARAERIVRSQEPPSRISEKPDHFGCRFCKHHAVCHDKAWSRVTCRSCLHSTAEMTGDAHWSCARWAKPLGVSEQKQACPAHLYIPAMVPGKQVNSDPEQETVTYILSNGETWTDGQDRKDAA